MKRGGDENFCRSEKRVTWRCSNVSRNDYRQRCRWYFRWIAENLRRRWVRNWRWAIQGYHYHWRLSSQWIYADSAPPVSSNPIMIWQILPRRVCWSCHWCHDPVCRSAADYRPMGRTLSLPRQTCKSNATFLPRGSRDISSPFLTFHLV